MRGTPPSGDDGRRRRTPTRISPAGPEPNGRFRNGSAQRDDATHGRARVRRSPATASVRVRAAPVLEDPADERARAEQDTDHGDPPADRRAQEDHRRRGGQRQRPPAVRAEEAVLPRRGLDRGLRVVLRPRIDVPGGEPQVPPDHERQARGQEQPDEADRLTPVGQQAVDDAHRREEEHPGAEEPALHLHPQSSLPWPLPPPMPPRGPLSAPSPSMSGSPNSLSRTFLSAVGASWCATSGWCRSNAGRSERIRGRLTKLCRGGGQEVAHSSDAPYPQGSSTFTRAPVRQVFQTLYMNGSVEAPSRNAPAVEIWFSRVKPSPGR